MLILLVPSVKRVLLVLNSPQKKRTENSSYFRISARYMYSYYFLEEKGHPSDVGGIVSGCLASYKIMTHESAFGVVISFLSMHSSRKSSAHSTLPCMFRAHSFGYEMLNSDVKIPVDAQRENIVLRASCCRNDDSPSLQVSPLHFFRACWLCFRFFFFFKVQARNRNCGDYSILFCT